MGAGSGVADGELVGGRRGQSGHRRLAGWEADLLQTYTCGATRLYMLVCVEPESEHFTSYARGSRSAPRWMDELAGSLPVCHCPGRWPELDTKSIILLN